MKATLPLKIASNPVTKIKSRKTMSAKIPSEFNFKIKLKLGVEKSPKQTTIRIRADHWYEYSLSVK